MPVPPQPAAAPPTPVETAEGAAEKEIPTEGPRSVRPAVTESFDFGEVSGTVRKAGNLPTEHTPRREKQQQNFLRRFFGWFTGLLGRRSGAGPKPDESNCETCPPPPALKADRQVVNFCAEESTRAAAVRLTAEAPGFDGTSSRFRWSVSGGRIKGDGKEVTWDLSEVQPGAYDASLTVESGPVDNPLCTAFISTKVVVRNCPPPRPASVCPNVSISCPDVKRAGELITYAASVSGGVPGVTPFFNWIVSAGAIVSGQGTPAITVDTVGLAGQPITATVEVDGYSVDCRASCQASVPLPPNPTKADEFPVNAVGDFMARLDGVAIELQSDPATRAFIIVYGTCAGKDKGLASLAKNYLVTTRGLDPGRIIAVAGGCRKADYAELWLVPPGAATPAARVEGPCPPCPSPSPEGEATPSPTTGPSPSASPSPTPATAGEEQSEKDNVVISYPLSLCFRRNALIVVTYDRKTGAINVGREEHGATANISIAPHAIPGAKAGPVTSAVPGARPWATAELTAQGFYVNRVGEETLPLDVLPEGGVQWKWQITPKGFSTDAQTLNVNIKLEFRDDHEAVVKKVPNWVDQDFTINVSLLTNGETAAISALFTAIFLALFGGTWKVFATLSAVLVAPRNVFNIRARNIGQVGDNNTISNLTQETADRGQTDDHEGTEGREE